MLPYSMPQTVTSPRQIFVEILWEMAKVFIGIHTSVSITKRNYFIFVDVVTVGLPFSIILLNIKYFAHLLVFYQ